MPARFHASDAERTGDIVTLPREEAEHLTRVLRLKAGAAVRIFNGRGSEFDAVVDAAANRGVQVRVGARREPAAEARVAVTLAQAVLKGDKMDDVIRDAVMMGVASIQPLLAARSEVTPASLRRGHRRERWQRVAVSSVKQCGRAVVPVVFEARSFESVAASLVDVTLPSPSLMFVEPSAAVGGFAVGDLETTPPREATALIGPEGGWTPEEIEMGSATCRLLTLGSRTLRADAMALVALTALFARWREL